MVEEVGAEILAAIEADCGEPLGRAIEQTARVLGTYLERLLSVVDLTRLEGTIAARVVRLRERVVHALTEVVHRYVLWLHYAGHAPAARARRGGGARSPASPSSASTTTARAAARAPARQPCGWSSGR